MTADLTGEGIEAALRVMIADLSELGDPDLAYVRQRRLRIATDALAYIATLKAERDTFYMDYRVACDEHTKDLVAVSKHHVLEIAQLRQALAEATKTATAARKQSLPLAQLTEMSVLEATYYTAVPNTIFQELAALADDTKGKD